MSDTLSNTEAASAQEPVGFTNPLAGQPGDSMAHIERLMFFFAREHGIEYVELQEATLGVQKGLRRDMLLPVVTDYLTHMVNPSFDWQFRSSYTDQAMKQAMDRMAGETQLSLSELMDGVREQVNRPALYNRASRSAVLTMESTLREQSGMPFGLTLLMLHYSLENLVTMSQQYQQQTIGEVVDDTLDLTPAVDALEQMNAHPRAPIPTDVRERAQRREQTARAALGGLQQRSGQSPDAPGENNAPGSNRGGGG